MRPLKLFPMWLDVNASLLINVGAVQALSFMKKQNAKMQALQKFTIILFYPRFAASRMKSRRSTNEQCAGHPFLISFLSLHASSNLSARPVGTRGRLVNPGYFTRLTNKKGRKIVLAEAKRNQAPHKIFCRRRPNASFRPKPRKLHRLTQTAIGRTPAGHRPQINTSKRNWTTPTYTLELPPVTLLLLSIVLCCGTKNIYKWQPPQSHKNNSRLQSCRRVSCTNPPSDIDNQKRMWYATTVLPYMTRNTHHPRRISGT